MRRRDFIKVITGSAVVWPLAARAQQSRDRVRRIGVLISFRKDAVTEALVDAFRQRLQELGWTEGRNVQFDYRYTDGNPERTSSASAELVALAPGAILADANPAVASLMQVTHTIPIVFTRTSDTVRERVRFKFGASRWKHYRLSQFRTCDCRKMARGAEGARTGCAPGSRCPSSRYCG
jgi:putative tryptophan/tyrosine transport system substrate-binding protein